MRKSAKELPADLKKFIKDTPWTFAKTYAKTWPHEYIVYGKTDNRMFDKLADHIDEFGEDDYFYETKRPYFEYDGLTYWHMGIIINRCPNSETYTARKKAGRLPKKEEG
jgi:hypothetical protein